MGHLGGDKVGSSLHHTDIPVLCQTSGQTEVYEFDVECLQVLTDNVLGLDVKMYDIMRVEVL